MKNYLLISIVAAGCIFSSYAMENLIALSDGTEVPKEVAESIMRKLNLLVACVPETAASAKFILDDLYGLVRSSTHRAHNIDTLFDWGFINGLSVAKMLPNMDPSIAAIIRIALQSSGDTFGNPYRVVSPYLQFESMH